MTATAELEAPEDEMQKNVVRIQAEPQNGLRSRVFVESADSSEEPELLHVRLVVGYKQRDDYIGYLADVFEYLSYLVEDGILADEDVEESRDSIEQIVKG